MAAIAVGVYKGVNRLGTGSVAANGGTTIASYTGTAPINGRNVMVTCTDGINAGASMWTKIISGSGTSSLVIRDKFPFTDA